MTRRQLGLAAAIAVGGGTVLLRPPEADSVHIAESALKLTRRYGPIIGYGDPARFFVPPYGPADAMVPGGSVQRAALADLEPALNGIGESLAAYPPGFYTRLCKAIFICGPLMFGTVHAGGTYGPSWIILAADPQAGTKGIRETARLGVHHEFSSLVWLHITGLAARWMALLPSSWRPTMDTGAALNRADEAPPDPRTGFLSPYAMTSAENDFNTYAEMAFGDSGHLVMLARQFPLVARKTRMLAAAYDSLDPRMAAVFTHLGLPSASANDLAPVEIKISPDLSHL